MTKTINLLTSGYNAKIIDYADGKYENIIEKKLKT